MVLSGVLSEYVGWRAVMLVNLPIAALALVTTRRGVPRREGRDEPVRLDVPGAILVTLGMAGLILGVTAGSEDGWAEPRTIGTFAVAAALLAAFVVVEARSRRPLMPLYVLGIRSVLGANVFGFMLAAAQLASFYFVSLYVQQVWGTSAQVAGLMFVPFCVFVVAGIQVATRLDAAVGPRVTLTVLGLVGAAGLFWFSRMGPDDNFLTGMLGPSLLGGAGIGGTLVVLGRAATAGVDPRDAGVASGVLNSFRQLGGTLGLAVLVSLAAATTRGSDAASPALALGEGYTAGLAVAAALLFIGALLGFALLARRERAPEGAPASVIS
ncbi:MFS transporter [Phytohabitans suffuscus]